MINAFSARELGRWLLAGAGVVLAFYATLLFGLFVVMSGSFLRDLAEPTAGFQMGLNIILTGSLLAPRQRLATALVLLISGTALATVFFNLHLLGTLAGGVVAVVLVAWCSQPRRTPRSPIRVGVGSTVACLLWVASVVFIGLVHARFVDRPARREALPPALVRALGSDASLVTAFYRYDLGGFLDHDWLWRIDADPAALALLVENLNLRRTNAVPRAFWRMPPHYWPRSMTARGEAFQSPRFSASRGPDGAHYFMLHDKTQNRAFVWLKDNF